MIHVHLGVNVINLYNKQIEINSLDQHPTESGHQKILHNNCYYDTHSLHRDVKKKKYFVISMFCLIVIYLI